MKSLSALDYLWQTLVSTEVHQNVDIVIIFEEVVEPHNVYIMQLLMYLDLLDQLLLAALFY